jgi:FixJ family two-component response regulator
LTLSAQTGAFGRPSPKGTVSSSDASVISMLSTANCNGVRSRCGGRNRKFMLKRQKIVAVIDDDPSFLRATRDLLDAHGLAARVFASAEEFLGRGAATQVDCVLLDIHLGGMSGIELRRQLKVSNSTLPVIFMTAHEDEHTRLQAAQAGCVTVLRKPYSAHQLMDAIERAVP